MPRRPAVIACCLFAVGAVAAAARGHEEHAATQPAGPRLSPLVARLLDDPITPADEKRAMLVFHGQWDKLEHPTPAEQAAIALARFDLSHAVLRDDKTAALLRARAALWPGEAERALKLLEGDATLAGTLLRAQALHQLGRMADAAAALAPWRDRLRENKLTTAGDLTAAAEALVLLAQLEGRPAQDYSLAMDLLGKARTEVDRLYWPAALAEARILCDKDNKPQAAAALQEVLQLHPRCGEAWYLAGRLAAESFQFDKAADCAQQLRAIHPTHLLAALLEARSSLAQRDPRAAKAALEPALAQHPKQRELLALLAAAEALSYHDAATRTALQEFDKLSPGSPLALSTVGQFLSAARQYQAGEAMLRAAIARQPNWPEPRVELGLLLMQAGDEAKAQKELSAAAALDPFNREAGNQLKLVEELIKYETLRTRRFVIRYKPGIDAVLARDMAASLDRLYDEVASAFGHQLSRPAVVQIMPDEQWFAVRVTGLPEIWTIAASMGDVIAITPPREGPRQGGPYDWARVVRHEFTHTLTLDQTANRIPHWFTEACAVSMEAGATSGGGGGGRDYAACQLLAAALRGDKLFALDQINWAFVRPRTPAERPLAYAQAHWMLEYLTTAFGHASVVKMLGLFRTGATDVQAIQQVTGQSPTQFMEGFRAWAQQQVTRWGLGAHAGDDDPKVKELLGAAAPDEALLRELLGKYPDHPELLLAAAKLALRDGPADAARQAVMRYATARPVDPWADQALVSLAAKTGRSDEAAAAMEQLDRQEVKSGRWAVLLAREHRAAGRLDEAAAAARRALQREPYNPEYRELAATIDVQRGELGAALVHLQAMTLLEPDQAIHFVRLAALLDRMGRKDEAKQAAKEALKLDPKAEVGRFLR